MELKDFKKGDKVYVLQENKGRNTGIKIKEYLVEKVGSKYITLNDPWGQRYEKCGENYFREYVDFGEPQLLFRTMQALEEYVEHRKLEHWLSNISFYKAENYSLEQLRKVREILGD